MAELFWILFWVMMVLPVVVYFSVKMGTYAFFRGRQSFYLHNQEKKDNGKAKT